MRFKDAVIPPQVAGIVKRHAGRNVRYGRDATGRYKVGDEFGVMDNPIITAKLRVFVPDSIETMRAGCEHMRDAVVIERLDILLRQRLKQILISHTPRRITRARFFLAENRKSHTRGLEDLYDRCCYPLVARVVGSHATDKV